MSSILRTAPAKSTVEYVSTAAFNTAVYSYSYNYRTKVGTLSAITVTSANAAAGVILRNTGRTLHPDRNNGVTVPMVSVSFIGASDGLIYTGYIDPVDPTLFALYSEHAILATEPATSDRYTGGLFTTGHITVTGGADISGGLDLSGAIGITGALTALGGADISGGLDVSGDIAASGRLYQQAGLSPLTSYLLVPVGCVFPYFSTTAPRGYLYCDGSGYDVTLYADLSNAIGYTFGGSGSTFNVPDLRGRTIFGVNGTSFAAIADVSGAETHTLVEANVPAHTHTVPLVTNTDVQSGTGTQVASYNVGGTLTTSTGSGTGTAFNIINPCLVLAYIIKY